MSCSNPKARAQICALLSAAGTPQSRLHVLISTSIYGMVVSKFSIHAWSAMLVAIMTVMQEMKRT